MSATVLIVAGVIWWSSVLKPSIGDTNRAPTVESASQSRGFEPSPISAQQPASASSLRAATIEVNGTLMSVEPNARGEFGRVLVPGSASIRAKVPFEGAAEGDPVRIQAEDGGQLTGQASQGRLRIDSAGVATLDFKVAAMDGVQRITLRHGADTRLLEFWVGAEQPVLVRN